MKKRISLVLISLLLLSSFLLSSCDLMVGTGNGGDTTQPVTAPSVVSCQKVSSDGLVDTWRITFSDDSVAEFTVTNGAAGAAGAQGTPGAAGAAGHSPTVTSCEKITTTAEGDVYRITFSDNVTADFTVRRGENGTPPTVTACQRVTGTATEDVYRIFFSDGATADFKVQKGKDGKAPLFKQENGELFVSYDESAWTSLGNVRGEAGSSVTVRSCEKVATAGLVDTWRITFSDGSAADFSVTNGADAGGSGDEAEASRIQLLVGELVKTYEVLSSTVSDGGDTTVAKNAHSAVIITGWAGPMTKEVMFGDSDKVLGINLNQFGFFTGETGYNLSENKMVTLEIQIRKPGTENPTSTYTSTLHKSYTATVLTNGTDDYTVNVEIPKSDLADFEDDEVFIFGLNVIGSDGVRLSTSENASYFFTPTLMDGSSQYRYTGYYTKDTAGAGLSDSSRLFAPDMSFLHGYEARVTLPPATAPSVVSCDKVATVGMQDTWRITFSDGSTADFTVTNGAGGGGAEWESIVNRVNLLAEALVKKEVVGNSSVTDGGKTTIPLDKTNTLIKGWGGPMTKEIMFGAADKLIALKLNQFAFFTQPAGAIPSVGEEITLEIEIRKATAPNASSLFKKYTATLVTNGRDDYLVEVEIPASDFASFGEDQIFILGLNPVSDSFVRLSPSYSDAYAIEETTYDVGSGARPSYCIYYTANVNPSLSTVGVYPDITFVTGYRDVVNVPTGGTATPEEEEEMDLLKLPEQYDLVVGDTFELFYKGITYCLDSDVFAYELSYSDKVSRGSNYSRKYIWKPAAADVGVHTLTIAVRDNLGNVLDEETVKINVVPRPTSPDTEKNVLIVGDSLTSGGLWVGELYRRLCGTGGTPAGDGLTNINFLGTREVSGTDGKVRYEGFGGWGFKSYTTAYTGREYFRYVTIDPATVNYTDLVQHSCYTDDQNQIWKLETIERTRLKLIHVDKNGYTSESLKPLATSGTLTLYSGDSTVSSIPYTDARAAEGNPFWNATAGKVDFTSYAKAQGLDVDNGEGIDEFIIFVGWNHTESTRAQFKTMAKELVDLMHAEFPECHVTLVTLQLPSRDGFGSSYGINWNYYAKMGVVYDFADVYAEIAAESKYSSFVSVVSLAGQFDAEYNYPTYQDNGNTRYPLPNTLQSNGVHPNDAGRYQIADAVYRHLATRLQ
ncbi:MAG: SGNH/GDSL hydrolase family protein [Clostridia bacterium]|nr:SGNH/GDSL hydrolase family protein [Clostridia bacterium]